MKNLENSVNCLDYGTDHTESYPAMILMSLSSMYTSRKTTRLKFTNQESGLAHHNSLQDIIGMGRPKRPGHPPKWVDQLLLKEKLPDQHDSEENTEHSNPVDPESGSEEESEDEPPASDKLLAGDMHSIPITSGSNASARAQSTCYGLRRKISPPERYT